MAEWKPTHMIVGWNPDGSPMTVDSWQASGPLTPEQRDALEWAIKQASSLRDTGTKMRALQSLLEPK